MAFSVTPDTAISEAAMFHGAVVRRTANQALSGTIATIAYDDVVIDTDGFWDASNFQFVIPEGVSLVQVGAVYAAFGAAPVGVEFRIRIPGTRPICYGLSESTNISRVSGTMVSEYIPVTSSTTILCDARSTAGTPNALASNSNYPNYFWLKVIKSPHGHPASPTLP